MPHVLKINFKDARYVDQPKELVLPARIVTEQLDMRVYIHVPCSKGLSGGILEGLKQELRKDG